MTNRVDPASPSAASRLWETCDGMICICHDPSICPDCGCLYNEVETATPALLDVERLREHWPIDPQVDLWAPDEARDWRCACGEWQGQRDEWWGHIVAALQAERPTE
jgi:hypothetical protein